MTAKELYEWAKEHNCENLQIGLQHQDLGGICFGDTYIDNAKEIYPTKAYIPELVRKESQDEFYLLLK